MFRFEFVSLFSESVRSLFRGLRVKPASRRRRTVIADIEGLENRALLSVNAVFNPETGELNISATKNSKVTVDVKKGQLTINGHAVQSSGNTASGNSQGRDRASGVTPDDISSLHITGSDGRNRIDLSRVNDALFTSLASVQVAAGGGDDRVVGSAFDDSIDGGAGDDDLQGGGGNDDLNGGTGDDSLDGGIGDDDVQGDDGDDSCHGGSGNDAVDGGGGDDDVQGDDGDDHCHGGSGNDQISGGHGADDLHGEDGDDDLINDDGQDSEDGGSGHDSDDDINDDHGGSTGGGGTDDPPGDDHGGRTAVAATPAIAVAVARKHGADDGAGHQRHEHKHRPNHR